MAKVSQHLMANPTCGPTPLSNRSVLGVATLLFGALLAPLTLAAQAPPVPGAGFASRYVVVLDPAHGGQDAGAHLTIAGGAGQDEKTFALTLGTKLRALLAARGFTVITTRDGDSGISATQRAETANRARAQACLSLHATSSGSGIHLYVSSLTPPPDAVRVPAWKTAQAAYVTRSLALAGVINAAMTNASLSISMGRTALLGMDSMTCPAVAVEVAPSPAGKQTPGNLDDPAYQTRVADALAAALVQWRSEGQQP